MFSGRGRKKKKNSNLNTCIGAVSFITAHPPTALHLGWAGSHTCPVFHCNVNAHLQYLCLPNNYSSHHSESKACSLPTHTFSAPKEKAQPLQAAPHLPTTTTQTNLPSPGWGAGPLGCFQLLCIYTGTNILSPVPCYQHMLANIPLGNLNHTVLVIHKTLSPSGNQSIHPLDTEHPSPQGSGTPIPASPRWSRCIASALHSNLRARFPRGKNPCQ